MVRLPLHAQTFIPLITYIPFIAVGACWGGLRLGVLTTGLCVLELMYFATERVAAPGSQHWVIVILFGLVGVVTSLLFDLLRQTFAEADAGRRMLDAVLSAQTDGILVCDLDGTVIRTNPAAEQYFGFDGRGMKIADLIAKFGLAGGEASSTTLRALRHGETTLEAIQIAGSRVLETSAAPMRDERGRITGSVTVSRDVTQKACKGSAPDGLR